MAGGGVAGQALVPDAARAAPAGPGPLLQLVHVEVQAVADVRLPVLLLLCGGRSTARRYRHQDRRNGRLAYMRLRTRAPAYPEWRG